VNPADRLSQAEQAERLRQDTLAFDQWHRHRERWFTLRFTMGCVAVVTLPVVCVVAAFVILNYEQFGAKAVTAASGALLTAVALLAAAWRQILSPTIDEKPPAPRGDPPQDENG
jgi:hypothetical protein